MLSERDRAEDVGGEPLLSLVLLERLLPVRRGEGEDAGLGPGRQQAQEVPDVPDRLDLMHLAARHEKTSSDREQYRKLYMQLLERCKLLERGLIAGKKALLERETALRPAAQLLAAARAETRRLSEEETGRQAAGAQVPRPRRAHRAQPRRHPADPHVRADPLERKGSSEVCQCDLSTQVRLCKIDPKIRSGQKARGQGAKFRDGYSDGAKNAAGDVNIIESRIQVD